MDPTAKDVGCGADDEAERHAERHGPRRHEKEHGHEDELRRDRAARSDLELDPRGERIGQEDQVAFRLTRIGSRSGWRIDDVYVDPFKER